MFSTKLEVDRHVENCLKKINNETERNNRKFAFAKLYFNVGAYEVARQYVASYLSVKPKSAEGHNLLGKALEKLGKNDAALEAYRTSLQLDPKQNAVVIKVCELLAASDMNLDQTGARYFFQMAQSLDPNNPAVCSLKEQLIITENKNPEDVSQLLIKELEMRPLDINLRVRLLKHLLQHNKINEAYKHASAIEEKNMPIFVNSYSWYEVVAEVLVRYQREQALKNDVHAKLPYDFWFLLISVLDKLVGLSLMESSDVIKTTNEYIATVFNFDQTLQKAVEFIENCPDQQFQQEFFNHYRAQLCFHLATTVFKQAKKDLIKYKDASQITLPLLLTAYHTQPVDLQSMWINHIPVEKKNLVYQWHKEAAFRCSQAGHVLQSIAKDRKSSTIEKATQHSTGMWREQLFKRIFIVREQQNKMSKSYFIACTQLLDITLRLPEKPILLKYDEVAQLLYPDSLHQFIWIALNNNLSEGKITAFDGLQYSAKNLNNCGAETLNILDIYAFIYSATLCAKASIENHKHVVYNNSEKPGVLPSSITEQLGTYDQARFLQGAYQLYKNQTSSDLGEIRLKIIRGLEIVRCVGRHGLDVQLLVKLATVFVERSKILTKQSEIDANDARAELYWKTALPLLEKLKNNQAVTYPANRLFDYKSKDMTFSEICERMDKGKLFLAHLLMKRKEHEQSLKLLEELKDPYASFYQAQIYKQMADCQMHDNKENLTSEMRSQNIILLSKARDCLYLTLDRLREPSVDKKHPLNQELGSEIEKIERFLSRIDPDCARNDCDGMSEENVSSADSTEHFGTSYSGAPHASFFNGTQMSTHDIHNTHSTPFRHNISKREARPSPERLDAQIRQLQASKDAALSHILDQNKVMVESHRSLVDELRSFKDAVYNLTTTVEDLKTMKSSFQELKDIKKSVDELKASVDELQNFRNISDLVYEMKKEITDLRKSQKPSHSQGATAEDLYVLDDDYTADFNALSATLGLGNQFQNYMQGRMPPNAAAAAQLAYHSMYPPLYSPMGPYGYPPAAMGLGPAGLPYEQLPSQLPPSLANTLPTLPPNPVYSQPLIQPPTQLPRPVTSQAKLTEYYDSPISTQMPQASTSAMFTPKPIFNTFTTSSQDGPAVTSTSASKAPPVNVVITSSDPLPSAKTSVPQPVLSVTIPPQHIKGSKPQPHNYQIPLPQNSVTNIPSVLSKPPPAIATESILFNVAPPIYSAVDTTKSPSRNISLGLQIEKSLSETFNNSSADFNNSNISADSFNEHNPCSDFKPIIDLPDEVSVTTGEENETVMFKAHAKLYRHFTDGEVKEWRERGVGTIKILQNPTTNKHRVLMRRDQVHKLCANHFITPDMNLIKSNEKTFIWVAHDFSEEQTQLEKFCLRFKNPEDATRFGEEFEKAKLAKEKPVEVPKTVESNVAKTQMGGFVFSSTPTFASKTEAVKPVETVTTTASASPFAGFTFGSKTLAPIPEVKKPIEVTVKAVEVTPKPTATNASGEEHDDFVPTAEFKPVVPLPALVEVKTGEENAEVLFDHRAKLLRFVAGPEKNEWKERGIGNMRILKEDTIRLVMRREQIHKVCCNHQLLKNMLFKFMPNNTKAITWVAQDFSEGVLETERFTIKFKDEEYANIFLTTITQAQAMLDDNNYVKQQSGEKHVKSEVPHVTSGFGDKFKAAKGSWECKNCYINNDGKSTKCAACETPKTGASPQKSDASGSTFSFGVPKTETKGWGDQFKAKVGSWNCKDCYTQNEGDKVYCVACDSPKDDSVAKKEANKGISLDTGGQTFSFGIPSAKQPEVQASPRNVGFGDQFKTKAGSWSCKACYIQNDGDKIHCLACESPKDDTIPKKEPQKGISLDTKGQTFSFGVPAQPQKTDSPLLSTPKPTSTFKFGESTPTTGGFSFGAASKSFTFTPSSVASPARSELLTKPPAFGSPLKHDFEFTPRSPRRRSSSGANATDEEGDGSFVEEEADNIYFKPIIPLPDKVKVETGEEQEEALYCHRAKLFRFVEGEWKERGLGDIKILKHKETGKLRVLMRREQIHKICLNHVLSSSIVYRLKDEKTWLFHAPDFSEGEISQDQFCLRFKNAEIATQFKNAIDNALGNKGTVTENISTPEDNSDVEIVSETKVTSEEESEAKRLGLPPKFFSYRQLPLCACEQCKKDDEYYRACILPKNLEGTPSNLSSLSKSNTSVYITPTQRTGSVSSTDSLFKTPENSDSGLLKSMLSQPSFLDQAEKLKQAGISITPVPKQTPTDALKNFSFTSKSGDSPSVFSSSGNQSVLGQSATPTKNIFANASQTSGNLFSTPTTNTSTGVFGAPQGGNLFSTPKSNTTGTVFGTTATNGPEQLKPTFGTPGNLFAAPSSLTTPTSVFGTPTTSTTVLVAPSSGFFGGSTTSATSIVSSSGSVFGSANTSIFGTPSNSNTSIFGGSQPASVFGGGSLFGATATSGGSLFGQAKDNITVATPIFGSNSSGDKATFSFGAQVASKETPKTTELKEGDELILKPKSDVSFSSLAQKTSDDFAKPKDDGKVPFSFLGAGAPVFSGPRTPAAATTKNEETEADEAETSQNNDEEHDPHYEPIVPLPDEIEVHTGEEEEQVMFNERAKLYRFDGTDWKERGVGQMKILHHPGNDTYRFLLRREQVHKVVLNQRITSDINLQPLKTSDKAWMWAGYNHTDDESSVEKLAIKFKSAELAQSFFACVQDILVLRTLPSVLHQASGVENVSDEHVQDQDDEYDYDGDYEDDRTVMIIKPAKLEERLPNGSYQLVGEGEIQMYYDPEIYGAKISFNDESGCVLSNTTVGINTILDLDGETCTWKAVEWAQQNIDWRNLRVTFESNSDASEFHMNYLEGLNYAQECDIVDELPGGDEEE